MSQNRCPPLVKSRKERVPGTAPPGVGLVSLVQSSIMWHTFLALPLVVRVATWTTLGVAALITAIKAKAIHAGINAASGAVSNRVRNVTRTWLGIETQTHSGNRTYKGQFEDYWYSSTPHDAWFIRLSRDGVTTTVPVVETNVLIGVKRGTLIEIDTEVRLGAELVRRLRVIT